MLNHTYLSMYFIMIVCLVHLENFLMLLILAVVYIWLVYSLLIRAYLEGCLYISACLKMRLGLT